MLRWGTRRCWQAQGLAGERENLRKRRSMRRGEQMSHHAERTAIQPATDRIGIVASPPASFPGPQQGDARVRLLAVPLLHRLTVLGVGLAVGACFALWVAGPMMPSGMRFVDRVLVWASVMSGPVVGTALGMAELCPPIAVGWLGLLLIPAHPARPSVATGCVTVFGLSLWF